MKSRVRFAAALIIFAFAPVAGASELSLAELNSKSDLSQPVRDEEIRTVTSKVLFQMQSWF